jgi:NAD(P)-dependent dehydrogenase (short-subunit alcohol dehydrogenase family)
MSASFPAAAKTGALRVDLAGRRILITGGSRGIAGAIARAFAKNGAAIALNYCEAADRRAGFPEAPERMLASLRQAGVQAVGIESDLTQRGVATALADRAIAELGGIDIVVLSASVQIHKDFIEQSEADIALQLQINLVANIQLLQRLIPPMRSSGWGRIISIGSVQEIAPSGEMPVYAMTKAAQENLVRNLAVQNARYGITVNNIAPGLVQTDRNAFRRQDPAVWDAIAARANPIGRAGQPDDIAGAALFLASDAASFVTGSTLQATGGAHIPWARADASHRPAAKRAGDSHERQ